MLRISPGGGIGIKGTYQILVWLKELAVAALLLYRRARYGYAFRRIRFSQPQYALVDPGDYHRLRKYEWLSRKDGQSFYAFRYKPIGDSARNAIVRMHREIIEVRKDRVADHINHNGVDNRRANLREATYSQNACNRRKSRDAQSKYKGVSHIKLTNKWVACINFNGKRMRLGTFADEIEAAKAYDEAAKEYHGEFACLNFPEKQPGRWACLYGPIGKKLNTIRPNLCLGYSWKLVVNLRLFQLSRSARVGIDIAASTSYLPLRQSYLSLRQSYLPLRQLTRHLTSSLMLQILCKLKSVGLLIRLPLMKTSHIRLLAALLLPAFLFLACQTAKVAYPPAEKGSVVDNYHGTEVADPYRWLEEPDSPETQGWVAEQNKLTAAFLADVPEREQIKTRLTELMDYARVSVPSKRGGKYFYWKNSGLQNQSVLYVRDATQDHPKVVINPNLLSEDGTAAVGTTAVSWDGETIAYGISQSGSDEQEIKIRTVGEDSDFDETLKWCRFTRIAWKHDNTGFFYSRYPDPSTVAPEDATNYNRVYWHKLNTPQSEDKLIYERPDNKELGFSPSVTEDGKYLILHVFHGTDTRNRIYYRPVESTEPFVKLLDKADAEYDFLGNVGSTFYFKTDLEAPRSRIVAIDIENPAKDNWQTVIPQTDDVIDRAAILGNRFVIAYMRDVHHQLKVHDIEGKFIRGLFLPTLGTVSSLSGRQDDPEMFFSFTSFLYPKTNYSYKLENNSLSIVNKPKLDFKPYLYETKQVFCESKDGTRVPIFITHRKGLELNGDNPTLLYGYGGFNIDIKPSFSTSVANWLEMGGVYAVANMRGGGEYGDAWHKAGMLENKQNVFDDFIAAAEWLIENKYTAPRKLAIRGGSNGGLLVGACMLQRPDLYGAVVCQVPVADMLRYHKFTVGRYWIPEYGDPETDPEMFEVLYAYSPLHNVKPGQSYPPILVTSADTDDRVVPMHSKKFVATLQEKAGGKNPIMLRVETKAGHGAGKPTSKRIEEQADIYAFLFKTLNMESEN